MSERSEVRSLNSMGSLKLNLSSWIPSRRIEEEVVMAMPMMFAKPQAELVGDAWLSTC